MIKLDWFFCRVFVPAFLLVVASSCSSDGDIQQLLKMRVEAPVFLECRPVSATELVFSFSTPVRVVSLNFDAEVELESVDEGLEVKVSFAAPLAAGKRITADILVEDSGRNTLNVIVPFRARNDRMPALIINEIRTDYSKPRVEFVEFFAPEAGNLAAMKFFIAGHSLSEPVYEFPAAEVSAGEYIVLHLRTLGEECVDETGTDLGLSGGDGAEKTARDFWFPGASRLLHRTSALWITDQDDRIIDAVLLCENPSDWGKNNSSAAAELLGSKGAWLPSGSAETGGEWIPGAGDAVSSKGTTATRTICRDKDIPPARRAGNWYITATSNATPGKENSSKRYAP